MQQDFIKERMAPITNSQENTYANTEAPLPLPPSTNNHHYAKKNSEKCLYNGVESNSNTNSLSQPQLTSTSSPSSGKASNNNNAIKFNGPSVLAKFKSHPMMNGPRSRFSTANIPTNVKLSQYQSHQHQRRSLAALVDDRDLGNDRIGWEYKDVTLTRIPRFGFGIAVSGGRDNPHFPNGDPAIAISDVLKSGPAEGKLQVNDRVISANGISLECVDYNTAVKVLRECGNNVNLLIKRRVLFPSYDLLKVTLTKNKKKDDFGIVLGCRLYIKEITNRSLTEKDSSIAEGDIVLKINNTSTENLSLKEAKKLIDSSKDKLNLVLKREQNNNGNDAGLESNGRFNGNMGNNFKENSFSGEMGNSRSGWSNQNVYVQPPTRGFGRIPGTPEDKNNMALLHQKGGFQQNGVGRHRGPITDLALAQSLDQPPTPGPMGSNQSGEANGENGAPRPPPPRSKGYGDDESMTMRRNITTEPRLISFKKEGSVGIRLTGGNEVGIFVCAVQPGSPTSLQGLQTGDKLLKVNATEMRGLTKEEAVLYLLSVQDQVDLIVQYCKEEYDEIVANQKGDSFYIRTHFKYDGTSKGELDFQIGEIFHVVDTLHNGVVGSWLVYRMSRKSEIQKGVIPNQSRAEEMAAIQNSEKNKKDDSMSTASRGGFFRRRSARRSKSLGKDHWEDVVFSDGCSKFSAYEKVAMKHPGFIRPVVLFGPLADIARDKLLKDYPDKYGSPQLEDNQQQDEIPKSQKSYGIVRLSAIREIIEKGKHALLDITPSAVDRLNYAQFAPIVIFLRAENKSIVKELRSRYAKSSQKSSRKLYESSVKLDKMYSHLFTSVITLGSAEMWYKKLRETIEKQQQINIWISESKPPETIADDFLFPMTSRLSYASSPESDLDLANESKGQKEDRHSQARLMKASSDPSIATVEEMPSNAFGPPPYNARSHRQDLNQSMHQKTYANEKSEALERDEYFASMKDPYNTLYPNERYPSTNGAGSGLQPIYMRSPSGAPVLVNGPEPPPRIDRANKPNRFRSAHEKLFGRPDSREQSPPDYINTTMAATSSGAMPNSPGKNSSLERNPGMVNGRHNFMDSSSYSSDSYKYISPASTLDERRYGSIASANSTLTMTSSRPVHDPYRFTRSTQQPLVNGASPSKQINSNSSDQGGPMKPMPHMNQGQFSGPVENNCRPNPPSPPPKPSNYQSIRMNDGRPVPPPKPMHYQQGRPPWRPEPEMNMDGHQMNGGGSAFQLVNRSSTSNMDMSGGPPAYFPPIPTKDQPPNTRAPGLPSQDVPTASYVNHSSLGSPTRRIPYSDTDSSSGYMTGKSNYDLRSQYSSKTSSSRSSSMMNGNGPYLNVPYPPRHRDSSAGGQVGQGGFTSSPQQQQQQLQPPPTLIDLSSNRENRGSAFELYRKPGDSTNRNGYPFHGLPPPPPLIPDHEAKCSPSISVDSNQNLVAMAKGVFDHNGGTLTSEETGVSLVIPEGAIPIGIQQEIYFKVCQDTNMLPPLDKDKDETLLSPIVMCGPHGIKFNTPVELRLPHCASVNPETSFALKLSDTPNGQPAEWQNITLGTDEGISASSIDKNYLSVLLEHF